MTSEDEIGRLYAQWHLANTRFKDLDKQFREKQKSREDAESRKWAIFERRTRSPRELLEEDFEATLAPHNLAYKAELKAAEEEYHRRVELAEEIFDRERKALIDAFAERREVFDDVEEEDWSSPEFEAAESEVQSIKDELDHLHGLWASARHELERAREAKKRGVEGR